MTPEQRPDCCPSGQEPFGGGANAPRTAEPQATHGPPGGLTQEDSETPAQAPQPVAPDVSSPPYDPWKLPREVLFPAPYVSAEENMAQWERARNLNREYYRQLRLARRWWKSKLGKQEFTRQRRRGDLFLSDFEWWLAGRSDTEALLEQHRMDVRFRQEWWANRSRPRFPREQGVSEGDR
jgi:hypothetical protein